MPDFSKDDFALEEDRRPQIINYFARQTGLPLRLWVDTSLSQWDLLGGQTGTAVPELADALMGTGPPPHDETRCHPAAP